MNSCEFLTIKEEIKSLKKEIKKTTKKLKKLELKARECYYSNLGKDVDNEIIYLDDGVLEEKKSFIDELNKNTDKIYQKITMNITDIDFGSIPDSEGDITKIENYELLVDALQDLEDLYTNEQDLTQINVVKDAIENVKANKGLFIKAFAAKADFPMTTYNTVVLSIVASITFLISATIEDPKTKNLNLAIDSAVLKGNSNDKLLLDNLVKFNKLCKDKNFSKFMNCLI